MIYLPKFTFCLPRAGGRFSLLYMLNDAIGPHLYDNDLVFDQEYTSSLHMGIYYGELLSNSPWDIPLK